jgi:hypothetical protein
MEKIFIGILIAFVVLVGFASCKKREECEAKGGVYLTRDWVCAKADAFIK